MDLTFFNVHELKATLKRGKTFDTLIIEVHDNGEIHELSLFSRLKGSFDTIIKKKIEEDQETETQDK